MTRKRALITGVTGQDGSYLAELLLEKGYEVFGMNRRTSTDNLSRVRHLLGDIELVDGDLIDAGSLNRLVKAIRPDDVYNLAAQSFVKRSFDEPEHTGEVTAMGVTRLLEALRTFAPEARFYQASSSEMFGHAPPPQTEGTRFYPRSPYGVAKVYAYWMTINYRESYGMFCCNGILCNHESPRRGKEFVTQKIAHGVAAIKAGKLDCLRLGNLDAMRDWGHARDYVRAMWMMLQADEPGDYVVATGEARMVRDFVFEAFSRAGMTVVWNGSNGTKEEGCCQEDGRTVVRIDPAYFRPAEVNVLRGDPSKARDELGWKPETSFEQLVDEMVDHAVSNPQEWE
jgi:GDPmannose 4,6-dehydratase